jgi:uncharacterized membrane protein
MPVARGSLRNGRFLLLIGISSLLILHVSAAAAPSWLTGTIAAVQGGAFVSLLAAHPTARRLALRYRAMLAAVVIATLATALFWPGLPTRSVALTVGGICHATAYACLLTWFAASLRPGQEPVVTGFARRIRHTMPATVVRYTRSVTLAWSVFFAAQLVISAALLVAAPIGVWSSFVNIWNLPLVAAMVLAEFGCRWFLFRHEPRTGLVATLTGLNRITGAPGNRP